MACHTLEQQAASSLRADRERPSRAHRVMRGFHMVALCCALALACASTVDAMPQGASPSKGVSASADLESSERLACTRFAELRDSVDRGNSACAGTNVKSSTKACIMNAAEALKKRWQTMRDAGVTCFDKAKEMQALGAVIGSCLQLEDFGGGYASSYGGYSYRAMVGHFTDDVKEENKQEVVEETVKRVARPEEKRTTGAATRKETVREETVTAKSGQTPRRSELPALVRSGCNTSDGLCRYWCCYYSVVYGSDFWNCIRERGC